ncbi:Tim44-like domain-containing protein [Neisseriaceae bacterium TC5R-5]|nr:Tim44-like domain-containing protein [Neisseriaceae bacterium TC5R-5]
MNTRTKTILLAFTMASVLVAPFAEAARMGKGKSAGMQRATPSRSYQSAPPAQAPVQQAAPAAPAQPRSGPGIGTAVAAGAAGAAAGYMLGSAMNDKSQPNAAAATDGTAALDGNKTAASSGQQESGMPWGTLALLGLALAAGLMFFRRKTGSPATSTPRVAGAPQANSGFSEPTRFDAIPKIGSGLNNQGGFNQNGFNASASTAPARLPDSTETPHFLRQAKATFLHLQSLNTPESLEEVRKYMTPELFTALRNDIADNSDVADFPQLDCQLASATVEGGRYIASVRFSGMVSEAVNAPAEPFTEYWHYIKDETTNGKWLVAGIQQD